tara:strand:- start:128 stop:814 length:687 start_codon:yes stop_codon:yes gene_type:complete
MNNFPYIDILILAMIAVFIINRLRNVLGKKTGNESDIVEKFTQGKSTFNESTPDKTIKSTKGSKTEKKSNENFHKDNKINDVLKIIYKFDLNFSTEDFILGAKRAFEYIIKNYSSGNAASIKKLLAPKMFDAFNLQINERNKKGDNLEITIISIEKPNLIKAEIFKKNFARIIVKFITEQVQVTKNTANEVIDGDNNQILNITENWSFIRNLKSKDPNWILEKIEENS